MKRLVAALVLGIVAFLVRLLRQAFADEEPGAPPAVPSTGRGGDAAPAAVAPSVAVAPSAAPAAVGVSPMDTPESSEPFQVRTNGSDETVTDTAVAAEDDSATGAEAVGTESATASAEARAPSAVAPAFSATPEAGGGAARGNYATPEATVTRVSRPEAAPPIASAGGAGEASGRVADLGAPGASDATGPTANGVGAGDGGDPIGGIASATTGVDVAETDLALPAGAVRGNGSRDCPATHPIKGNAGSMIYHTPGSGSYAATIAEFCFASADRAEAAGFRAPRRG